MGELTAICGEDEFAELVRGMVDEEAPRLFAVVQELGDRVDARIAGWGLAFEDHAEVVAGGVSLLNIRNPERVCQLLSVAPDVTARLVWVTPLPAE